MDERLPKAKEPSLRTDGLARRLMLVVALVAAIDGCHGGERTPSGGGAAAAEAKVARTELVRGPVRVVVEFEPQPAQLSDAPTLRLTIEYQQGVQVEKPPFGDAVGDFVVRDFREPLPEIHGDREVLRQIYTLEPTRTGKLQIDPIAMTFVDNRPDGDGKQHAIETEALSVEVTSVVGSEAPSLGDLQPAAGPVELREANTAPVGWLISVVLVVGAGGLIFWWQRRRRHEVLQRRLSPQELAYQELQQLIEEGWVERDVKRFYVDLTGIVRRYIEGTTGVRAPEQTTEEFLHEIGVGAVFSPDERRRLKDFLEAADLVKYAAHQPDKVVIEDAFARANVFMGLSQQSEVAA